MDFLKSLPCFIFSVVFSLGGQALLKTGIARVMAGARPSPGEFLRQHLIQVCLSPWVISGIFLSGIGLVGYMYVLVGHEVGRALPVMGGVAYIGMFVVSRLILREESNWMNFAGILCIIAGLGLVSMKSA
jgi:multidrug transporter EmrE-like cation transporter